MRDAYKTTKMLREPMADILKEFQENNRLNYAEMSYLMACVMQYYTFMSTMEVHNDDRDDSV